MKIFRLEFLFFFLVILGILYLLIDNGIRYLQPESTPNKSSQVEKTEKM